MSSTNAMLTLAQDVRIIEGFGGLEFKDQTTLHPLGLVLTLLCGVALLVVRRPYALWPFIALACLVSSAQRLVFLGLDFNLIRLLVLFGFARLLIRGEVATVRWRMLDLAITAYALSKLTIYTLQYQTLAALVYQGGQLFDAIGLYFLFRYFVRSPVDIFIAARGFALMAVPIAIAFAIENQTGHNVFSAFGGVPEITMIREGRMRCQGAFAHPIIAGCFWASVLPLIASLWWRGTLSRPLAVVGSCSALAAVGLSASSTPVMAVLMGLVGAALFLVRHWVRWVFFAACTLAVVLHLVMKAPVWHLISRITIAKGNTAYFRFQLIDSAIHRFDEWALLGTKSTAHWFWGAQDLTNQYIFEGVQGGVLTLLLFIVMITLAFLAVGRTWRAVQRRRDLLILSWGLGTAMFVHCTSFIGVSYFGQIVFLWYFHLAVIASFDEYATKRAPQTRPLPAESARRSAHARAEKGSAMGGFM